MQVNIVPVLSIHGPEAQTKACHTDGRSVGDVLPKEAGRTAVYSVRNAIVRFVHVRKG